MDDERDEDYYYCAIDSLYSDRSTANYDKSTLCPADLENYCDVVKPQSSSLTHLCCVHVARQAEYLINDNIYLPSNLYKILMTEAIRENLSYCAAFLISTWQLKIISMVDVIPFYLAPYSQSISGYFGVNEVECDAFTAIILFLRLCVDVLRKGLTPFLRVFDLRGWLLSDQMTYYVVREIVSLYREVRLLHEYHIIIDCKVGYYRTYDELMKLFAINSESRKNKIHLHIKKLDLSLLDLNDEDKIWTLLQRVDQTELIGLAMPYFSNEFLASIFKKFQALTALRLEEVPGGTEMEQQLPLHMLPLLRRLGFSTLDGTLSTCVPTSTLKQLEYLDLRHVNMVTSINVDLYCMTSVPWRLRELNLSHSYVRTDDLQVWRKLFLSLAPTLLILVLEQCIRYDEHFATMISFVLPLTNLIFLDLIDNKANIDTMWVHVPKLASMPKLTEIALSCPEVNSEAADDRNLIKLKCQALKHRLATEKLTPVKITWYLQYRCS